MVCAYLVTIYNLCIHSVLRYRCRKWLKDISNLLQATWCGMNSYIYREREVGPCLQIHWNSLDAANEFADTGPPP